MLTDDRVSVDEAVDIVVIGGGVNGTGVARDLALRGLRVALVERHDFAFGASGNSSGMIHGGLRYLSSDPNVTESACLDSGYIQKIAPHLLFRIPFLMPVASSSKGRVMMELLDAYFRAYDDYQPLKRGEPHTRIKAEDISKLEPGIAGAFTGAITFDEWGIDGSRLCTINALDARENGARVHVHTVVESIAKIGGVDAKAPATTARYVVHARNVIDNTRVRISCAAVVNATGAWGPLTAALGNIATDRVRVRPGKGIHVVYDRRLSNYAIVSSTIDGRQIFLEPWQNVSIIGTTDDDYYGDLNDVTATSEEVRYLVQGIAHTFPSIRQARAIGTYAGVRPTLYEYGPHEDALSREHMIIDHASDGAPGVYSMIGGKLASYRVFSQEMSDMLAKDFAPKSVCTTHTRSLPGGDRQLDALAIADANHLDPVLARRLVYRHGSRAELILQRIARHPSELEVVCPCEPVTAAEIRYVVCEEMAETVDDVARRTRLGLGACGGMRCAARCAQIVAEERELSPQTALKQARAFLTRQAKTRVVAMGVDQARQEATAIASMRSSLGTEDEA